MDGYITNFVGRIDWPNLLAGALIAAVPVVIPYVVAVVRFYFNPQRQKYRGVFHLYHWSGTRNTLRHKEVRFSTAFRRNVRVTMPSDSVTHLAYTGVLSEGIGDAMYAILQGNGHRERMTIAFYNPIDMQFAITRGLMLTVNLHDEPTAWTVLLSRRPLPEDEAARLLGPRELLSARKVDLSETTEVT